ncbi:t-SNARE affecting a late Golgi compartment protein 2 [Trichomonascus vanleenenianus]|uniref:t-SNARE syntaxin TLG2 n=1 Tax=Trichomonascus vanleenenianus TaxID=2268995 RepID=UPI003ECB1D9B
MFRDRTNLYVSFRQSYARYPQFDNIPEEAEGLIASGSTAIEMDRLPPSWVDVSDEIGEAIAEIEHKIAKLDGLHRKTALPSFDDRTLEEREIEQLTLSITQDLHRCQGIMKRFDRMTDLGSYSAAEQKMAANMKISLATKVQDTSTIFRKMQSSYLKSLRNESSFETPYDIATAEASAPGEDDLDVAFSQSTLQQQKQQQFAVEDETIRQREREITQIAQGILELAEIFKDLQTMVIDQGTLLDRIDYNIETMYTNVRQADKELVQAHHYQKRSTKCKLILLLSLIVFGLLLAVILKPKHHSSPAPSPPPPPQDNNKGDTP